MIRVEIECDQCGYRIPVVWPDDQYSAIIQDRLTLDGTIHLPDGWYCAVRFDDVPIAVIGRLLCPEHATIPDRR